MVKYTICNIPDVEVFEKQCAAFERAIPSIERGERLEDVDGTLLQFFIIDGIHRVEVRNDIQIGAVLVDSEIPLEQYFRKD